MTTHSYSDAKPERITIIIMAKTKEDAKVAFRKLIEVYKSANPKKYEMKKEALEAKLNSL